jgi:ADP-heptose:LPS heptosyltransferase
LLEIVSALTRREYDFDDVRFPDLHWTDEDREALRIVFPDGAPTAFVVVHPFAKEETRRYPAEYWPPLLEALEGALGVPLVTVGGKEDVPLEAQARLVRAEGRLTLGQTAYLLSRAAGFVGNLSGPAHLAAALGTPTVTLMSGNSLPVEWAPLGDSLVLRAEVPCSPCHRSVCPGYGLACLYELTPARVARLAIEFLAERLSDDDRVRLPSAGAPETARRP